MPPSMRSSAGLGPPSEEVVNRRFVVVQRHLYGRYGIPYTMQKSRRIAVVGVALVVSLCLLSMVNFTQASSLDYVLVIDAGSTGTRMYAYKLDQGRPYMLPTIRQHGKVPKPRRVGEEKKNAYQRVETEPGLHTYAGDTKGTRERALGPLLDWARDVVPADKRAAAPVLLMATAGVRNLPEARREELFADVRRTLGSSGFRFEPDWARIITGSDEGKYGWIALNYWSKHLTPPSEVRAFARGAEDTPQIGGSGGGGGGGGDNSAILPHELFTVGALDLGGSSLEVSYVPAYRPGRHAAAVSVAGVDYRLNVYSHHHYGMNDAFDTGVSVLLGGMRPNSYPEDFATAAVAAPGRGGLGGGAGAGGEDEEEEQGALPSLPSAGGVLEVRHPCLQAGYNQTYARQVRDGVAPSPTKVRLVGAPDWGRCSMLASAVVNATAECGAPPCTLGTSQPPLRGRLYGLTGFYVIYHFFGLPTSAPLDMVLAHGERYCKRRWADVEADYDGVRNVDRYCFRAPYVVALLREGLGVLDSQVTIGPGDLAWTMGAALAEGSNLRVADERARGGGSDGRGGWELGAGGGASSGDDGGWGPSIKVGALHVPWVVLAGLLGAAWASVAALVVHGGWAPPQWLMWVVCGGPTRRGGGLPLYMTPQAPHALPGEALGFVRGPPPRRVVP